MKSNFERIGDHIRLVDERNRDESIKTLLGLTIEKVFIPSVANTIGSDMANYKVIRRGQFACSLMQVRRDKRMPVALLDEIDEAIISQAYPVFQIKDSGRLDPEYLMMWFRRPEFDREACFHAVGGVRGSLEWEDFCNLRLPVPSPEKQREIVVEYETVVKRIALNEKLGRKLEETAQAIYKHWFVDFEFPMSAEDARKLGKPELEGKPYKSSGGEMLFDELLEKEIPKRWSGNSVAEFCTDMKSGGTPNRATPEYWNSRDIPWLKTGELTNGVVVDAEEYISLEGLKSSSARIFERNTVLVALYGDGKTKGQVAYLRFESATNQASCGLKCSSQSESSYLFYFLRFNKVMITNQANGGAQENLSKDLIGSLKLPRPSQEILESHPFVEFLDKSESLIRQNIFLSKLRDLILSRLAISSQL